MTEYIERGKVIFEIPEDQLRKRIKMEESMKPLSIIVEIALIILLLLLFIVFPFVFDNFSWEHYSEILVPSILAILGGVIVYIDYLLSKQLNRFAIYEKGISPPMKPLKKD